MFPASSKANGTCMAVPDVCQVPAPPAPPPSTPSTAMRNARDGATERSASSSASPATNPSEAAALGSNEPTRSKLAARLPGGVAQARPRRPRPAVWWAVTNQARPASPPRAASSASALVEPISEKALSR